MIFLALMVSLNLLSTGNLQQVNDVDKFKISQENLRGPVPELRDQWPVQTIQTVQGNFFGQAFRNINAKPCSNRRNLQELDEQWIPTYSSKSIKQVTNLDNPNLNVQTIKEENDGIKYAPVTTPIVKQNAPTTVLVDNENNLYNTRSSLAFNDLTEKEVEDPTEEQNELTSEDRSDIGITDLNNDALAFVINDKGADTSTENDENIQLGRNQEEQEPESENTVETVDLPDECVNKKKKMKKDRLMGDTRRSMLKFESQNKSADDKADNKLHNDNLLTTKEENRNVNTRKATQTKLPMHVRLSSQDPVNKLPDPAQGSGVTELSESRMMLMDYSRLCYACSTAGNPTCWAPDRKTTVKYCRKGHEACVTKTFQTGNALTLIRDCGNSCEDVDIVGFAPKYKTCSICHSDLCNSAYTINSRNVIFAFVLITVIKCIF